MRIEFSSAASKQFRKLKRDKNLFQRINAALDEIADQPHANKLLDGEFTDVHSKRVGDWRILYEILDDVAVIVVIRIAHRSEVYR